LAPSTMLSTALAVPSMVSSPSPDTTEPRLV
jgi:hypothetical protein